MSDRAFLVTTSKGVRAGDLESLARMQAATEEITTYNDSCLAVT